MANVKRPSNFGPGNAPSIIVNNGGGNTQCGFKVPKPGIDPWRSYKGGKQPIPDPAMKSKPK